MFNPGPGSKMFSNLSRVNQITSVFNIKDFRGHLQINNNNVMNYPVGTMMMIRNMEFAYSGIQTYLRTRRGTTLIKDITYRAYGAGLARFNSVDYPVWLDKNGNLKYYNSTTDTITTIKSGLASSTQTSFFFFGLAEEPALYLSNRTNGVMKVNSSFVWSSVMTSNPIDRIAFSNISGRKFGIYGHTVRWTKVQQKDADNLTNLEDWDTSNNLANVSPDEGSGFKALIDDGQSTFFFKDTGIWVLPNAGETQTDWIFPKCNADQGTRSPETVRLARYAGYEGIVYLATDKTLRFFNARVIRNAGAKPTLEGGDSVIISNEFQKLLSDIPEEQLENCSAVYYQQIYILNIFDDSSSRVTIGIDLSRSQPGSNMFWFYLDNFEFTDYIKLGNGSLYGFNSEGFISRLFVDDKYHDEVPDRISYYDDDETDGTTREISIRWSAYTGWIQPAENQLRLHDVFLNWRNDGNWSIDFYYNSFLWGEYIPEYDESQTITVEPVLNSGNSYFDQAIFNQSYFSSNEGGQHAKNTSAQLYGDLFLFGWGCEDKGHWASIFGIRTLFATARSAPMSRNI